MRESNEHDPSDEPILAGGHATSWIPIVVAALIVALIAGLIAGSWLLRA